MPEMNELTIYFNNHLRRIEKSSKNFDVTIILELEINNLKSSIYAFGEIYNNKRISEEELFNYSKYSIIEQLKSNIPKDFFTPINYFISETLLEKLASLEVIDHKVSIQLGEVEFNKYVCMSQDLIQSISIFEKAKNIMSNYLFGQGYIDHLKANFCLDILNEFVECSHDDNYSWYKEKLSFMKKAVPELLSRKRINNFNYQNYLKNSQRIICNFHTPEAFFRKPIINPERF